tara:strand:+ start:406 stop:1158 length:753 start_codon:yes stop_codon:yes gene_type:complete
LEATLTEIPEHLLKRSKAARGEKSDSPEPSGEKPKAEPAAQTVEPKTETPKVEVPPKPEAPYVSSANNRKKIPWWAASTLIFLPLWAYVYVGTLERPPEGSEGILAVGEQIYSARCASCHGANGGGGSGPALNDGELLAVFPSVESQLDWVIKGSDIYGAGNTYGDPAAGRVVEGGMPGWGDVLTTEELIGVVLYERSHHAASEEDTALAEAIEHGIEDGSLVLPEYFDSMTGTIEDLELLLSPVKDHSG